MVGRTGIWTYNLSASQALLVTGLCWLPDDGIHCSFYLNFLFLVHAFSHMGKHQKHFLFLDSKSCDFLQNSWKVPPSARSYRWLRELSEESFIHIPGKPIAFSAPQNSFVYLFNAHQILISINHLAGRVNASTNPCSSTLLIPLPALEQLPLQLTPVTLLKTIWACIFWGWRWDPF